MHHLSYLHADSIQISCLTCTSASDPTIAYVQSLPSLNANYIFAAICKDKLLWQLVLIILLDTDLSKD